MYLVLTLAAFALGNEWIVLGCLSRSACSCLEGEMHSMLVCVLTDFCVQSHSWRKWNVPMDVGYIHHWTIILTWNWWWPPTRAATCVSVYRLWSIPTHQLPMVWVMACSHCIHCKVPCMCTGQSACCVCASSVVLAYAYICTDIHTHTLQDCVCVCVCVFCLSQNWCLVQLVKKTCMQYSQLGDCNMW